MVNNFTKINKANYHLSSQTIKYKKVHAGNQGPDKHKDLMGLDQLI
jgi:hypothetical protein